jgi:uncharacterized metal-binding protein
MIRIGKVVFLMRRRSIFILSVFLILGAIVELMILPIMSWATYSDNLSSWAVISIFSGILIAFKIGLIWFVWRKLGKTKKKSNKILEEAHSSRVV